MAMPLLLDTAHSGATVELRGGNCLTIGLVNNMPDTAVEATEQQFLDLVRAATADAVVCFRLFSIPDVARGDQVRASLAGRYRDVSELWDTRLDGLIVTGTEPRAATLHDEPYWGTLSKLVTWAREHTGSTIWSCLAAHAAVLQADGIERLPLEDKQFGVFEYEVVGAHPLANGAPPRLRVPHSRYNDLPEPALAAGGYRLLARSSAAGVDSFVREEAGRSLFVFLQGHPEYAADTLAREYRRDVGRFLRGEREDYPAPPHGYFNAQAMALADSFRTRAMRERDDSLMADFPMSALAVGLENTWRHSAVGIYKNWVDYLKGRRTEQRALMRPLPRARRDAWRIGDVRPGAEGSVAG
jgi:homoserine O-succinyltransferase/O-acetyltransferase